MTKREKLLKQLRLEFIEAQQQGVNSLMVHQYNLANKLSAYIMENYEREISGPEDIKGIGEVLVGLLMIVNDESEYFYRSTVEGIRTMTRLGVAHTARMNDKFSGFLSGLVDKFVDNNVNYTYPDGIKLSKRIWKPEDKSIVLNEAYKHLTSGTDKFDVAKKLTKYVKTGRPIYVVDRLVSTEMARSYVGAKYDSFNEIYEELGEDFIVEVKLSPFHPKADICDKMVGKYKISQVTRDLLPPFHPWCICMFDPGTGKPVSGQEIGKRLNELNQSRGQKPGESIGDYAQRVQRGSLNPVKQLLPDFEDAMNAGNFAKCWEIIKKWELIGTPEAIEYAKSHSALIEKFSPRPK